MHHTALLLTARKRLANFFYVALPCLYLGANSYIQNHIFDFERQDMNATTLRTLVATAAVCAGTTQPALAASVSISVHQPGVYGRIVLGGPPPPAAWVVPQPVVIAPPPIAVQRQPIYLYVPPAHSSNWARYCNRYNACAQPVIFVQDRWVRERHAAYYRDRDGDGIRNTRDRRPNNPYLR
jgi:hypothetical protein